MRAQPPGSKDISIQQAVPVQHCKNWTEIKRLVGCCSLIGRKELHFSPDRVVVTRIGVLGVLVSITDIFPPVCKSISVTAADSVASAQRDQVFTKYQTVIYLGGF